VDFSVEVGARGPPYRPDACARGQVDRDVGATLLSWRPGQGVDEHVNEQCDVLLVVVAGSGRITVDGDGNELRPGLAVLVEKGRARAIEAAAEGLRYLSVHVRRALLQLDL
jgi:quercetin dioxygenase-like cupin family protein